MMRVGLMAAGVGMAALLSACGGGDDDFASKKGEDIADAAKADMGDLKSVRVGGTITSGDQDIDLDLQVSTEGDCTGSLGIGGGSTELLGVDGQTWMRPDEAFWTSFAGDTADQIMAAVGDKWVVIPSDEDSFNQFCDLDELLDQMLTSDDSSASTYTTKDTSEIDGDTVVAVDDESDDGTSTGYVLVDSPHYLVKIDKTGGDSSGTVTFTDFDEDVDVSAPADDEVVDLNSLGS
ncbi:hypothetical protein [Nocardioides mangrovi]|uniref:LppX_LprAFG lipoprotein n=1 Tax=Nocardioides mangrovi TaxID=2874580 RepID=A0ABS7UJA3_9ACTN|nr:hypothetical protein [Nocardioides mangrovi]MBZ5740962.1 hypothetical protein [Nocardioides mangrovi]